MSLIGSLEDLGLGDILQIISLSQKSGVLSIRGDDGEGEIVLKDGLVRGATLKGGPIDLRGVLVGGQFLDSEAFDAACEQARGEGVTVEEAIAGCTDLSIERIDSLRRECVEAAVMAMFAWHTGEFSFDVRTDVDGGSQPLFLPHGINAQYLAMEGSRIEDESTHIRSEFQEEAAELPDEPPEMSAEEMFGVDPAEALAVGPGIGDPPVSLEDDPNEDTLSEFSSEASPVEALGLAVAERVAPVEEESPSGIQEDEDELLDAQDEDFAVAEPVAADAEPTTTATLLEEPTAEVAAEPVAAPAPTEAPIALPSAPLVVIDPDLVALEWIKQTLKDVFPRIHIFQRWDLGLNPIRQYLARAVRPVVLVSLGSSGDPLSGIRSAEDFVGRLKGQQPQLPVLWLHENDSVEPDEVAPADAVLVRPSSQQLRSPRAAGQLGEMALQLRATLAGAMTPGSAPAAAMAAPASAPTTPTPDALSRLKRATDALAEASSRGEVLPLVIRFAAETFQRVAMFGVRADSVVGIAQHGLSLGGGPSDEALRQVELSRVGCAWLRAVLDTGRPVRSGPDDGGDYTLAALLGNSAAREAYLAPIESSGEIVAVLYADNLPDHAPLGDTEALEVVLQHAGLALERNALERTLAEVEQAPAE